MKKLFLLTITIGLSMGAFAQNAWNVQYKHLKKDNPFSMISNTAARTTAIGDTDILSHITDADTDAIYTTSNPDSGYVFGINAFGDKAYAERYDIDSSDSTVKVLGEFSFFTGTLNPASTKTVTFNVWSVGAKSAFGTVPHTYYGGLPSAVLATRANIPITALGIDVSDTSSDTGNVYLFATPTAFLRTSFFVGYSINYSFAALGGDTIGRTSAAATIVGTDTLINDVNVTQLSTGVWEDNQTGRFRMFNNLEIFPIVKIGNGTLSVKGITKNDFTFFGNYPNPAVDGTNIKFSLAKATDVTITISDLNGRTVNTISQANLGTGEHIIPVSTSNLAAGNYIYVVRTGNGDGIASTLTVAK